MTSSPPAVNPVQAVPPVVEIRQVTYLYPGDRGVRDVSLTLAPGGVLALLGPNGSGKSTILHLVAGLLSPQDGAVHALGEAVGPHQRRRIGILFQESSLDPQMSARDTLWLHGRLFGLGGATLRRRIAELLALVGLADRAQDEVATLSGGMRRRLELARAVLHQPPLLLLDEPTVGLDPDSKAALWDLLRGLNRDGATLLISTNDVIEAERYCAAVALLDRGRVVAQGTPAGLKQDLRRDAVKVEWPHAPSDVAETLAAWEGVGRVTAARPLLHATVDDASAFVPRLFALADGGIHAIRIEPSTLEDVYFQIVGAPLSRDGAGAARP